MEPGNPAQQDPGPRYPGGYGPPSGGYATGPLSGYGTGPQSGYGTGPQSGYGPQGGFAERPPQGSWGPTPQDPIEDRRPVGPQRGRPALIAFAAFAVELVIIAAAFNQAVSKHLERYVSAHDRSEFFTNTVASGLVYSWRITSTDQVGQHVERAELVMVGSVFLLTVLLSLAVVRGPISWGRAFFGVWMAVIVATCLARIPAILVADQVTGSTSNKINEAVFGGPTGYTFFGGVQLGLVVALISSLVAMATRRPPELLAVPAADPGPRFAPEPPPPYYGEAAPRDVWATDRGPDAATSAYPAMRDDSAASQPGATYRSDTTAQLPVTEPAASGDTTSDEISEDTRETDDANRTTTLPRVGDPDAETSGERTAAFPLPPDDESLGYHADPERD